jgi:Protein of unknown function (DUF3515)
VTASAPPLGAAEAAPCAKVLAELPVQLGALNPRIVHTDSPYVVAWGEPAVFLRCGVARPKDLVAGSSAEFINGGDVAGPYFDVTANKSGTGGNVYTTVDRGPYISITVPAKYQGATVLPPLSSAIAKALPAVCSTDPNEPDPDKLCTRRK